MINKVHINLFAAIGLAPSAKHRAMDSPRTRFLPIENVAAKTYWVHLLPVNPEETLASPRLLLDATLATEFDHETSVHCSICSTNVFPIQVQDAQANALLGIICRDCAVTMRILKKKIQLCFECCGTLTSRLSRTTKTTTPSDRTGEANNNTLVLSPPQAASQDTTRPCESLLFSTVGSDLEEERELMQQVDACLSFLGVTQDETTASTPTTTVAVVMLSTPEPFQSLHPHRRLSFQDYHECLPFEHEETAFRSCRARLVTTKQSVRDIRTIQQQNSSTTAHHQFDNSTTTPEATREAKCSEPIQESKEVALESATTYQRTTVQGHYKPSCNLANEAMPPEEGHVVDILSSTAPNSSDDMSSKANDADIALGSHGETSNRPKAKCSLNDVGTTELLDKSPQRPESTKNNSVTTKTNSTLGSSRCLRSQRRDIGRHNTSYRREVDTFGWPSMSHAQIKMDLLVGCPLGYLPPI
ncbi:hypothetical protein AC1031_006515 [Aphanomyces cochlioides]|nr:hypothetical protein AC1031_006515 [Aphanomyces cochlioides]